MVVVPQLETERLLLRAPRESDCEAMQDYLALERTKFIGGPYDETATWRTLLSMLGHWQLKGYGFWQIEHRQTGRLAGAVGFINHFDWPEPELGWSVHHDLKDRVLPMKQRWQHARSVKAPLASRRWSVSSSLKILAQRHLPTALGQPLKRV